MAEFLGSPKVQYFETSTGQPLSGGKLYTYEPGPGSTTPKATYSSIVDALAATNANTNPILLDSRGEATVVLAGSTKLVLKRADDTLVWSEDAVGTTGNNVFDENGNAIVIYSTANGAVNEITITNAATTMAPSIKATGGDTNINLDVLPKGTGGLYIGTKILDSSYNEQLMFTETASAVNYVDISNSTTGGGPIIRAKGDDADVALSILAKGTAAVKVGALNMPTADGTAGQFLTTNGTGTLGFVSPQASQADQETGTSNTTVVTPGVQRFHKSAAKAWVKFGVSGNILDSYNVSSVADLGLGRANVNWNTTFNTTNYTATLAVFDSAASAICTISSQSTGTLGVQNVTVGASFADPSNSWHVIVFGDLP